MTARGSDRFRNYNIVLERYEKAQRLKKILKVFFLFAVILFVVMVIIFLTRWEQRATNETGDSTTKTIEQELKLKPG